MADSVGSSHLMLSFVKYHEKQKDIRIIIVKISFIDIIDLQTKKQPFLN